MIESKRSIMRKPQLSLVLENLFNWDTIIE